MNAAISATRGPARCRPTKPTTPIVAVPMSADQIWWAKKLLKPKTEARANATM